MTGKGERLDRAAGEFGPEERAAMQAALEAVCDELGVTSGQHQRRRAIELGILAAYRQGRRQPLYLVDAGLGAVRH